MRIALLIEKFGATGGAERQVAALAGALAARGESVHVFASAVRDNVRHVTATALETSGPRAFALAAKASVQAERFDVIHSFARTLSQDILRLGGGVHAEYLKRMEPARSAIGRWFSRVNPKERAILRLERDSFDPSATRLIQAVSHRVKEEVSRHYGVDPTRIVVTHNAVDIHHFHPGLREHRAHVLAALSLPADTFLVLFAGGGFKRKGLASAIRSLALLPSGSHACLIVLGSGDAGPCERLAERLKVNAQFLGSLAKIEPYYGAADALVLPTLYDPFPNVCLEAMACGVPVVVTRVAGVSEIIADGIDAFVVDDPGKPEDIARRLEKLLDPAARAAMGRAARALAERHPFERYVEETLSLYQTAATRMGV
ncbi:MAG: glycosyltransferase family 4 protein [Planctomycetes bacterium]|nr:glycosyltransferase family 4 protein [Planctomycetota bacterium]